MTPEEKAREAVRMRDVESWPSYPHLHVKKLGPTGYVAFGLVVASRPYEVRLKPRLFDAPSTSFTVEAFESVEAMIDAGWIGD